MVVLYPKSEPTLPIGLAMRLSSPKANARFVRSALVTCFAGRIRELSLSVRNSTSSRSHDKVSGTLGHWMETVVEASCLACSSICWCWLT